MNRVNSHPAQTRTPHRRMGCFMLAVGMLLAAGMLPAPAQAQKPATGKVKQTAAAQPRLAPGYVSAAEAIQRIDAHMQTITHRKTAMSALYDFSPSVATMTEAFRRNGANQWSIEQYADTFGQNGAYLTWDVVQSFYDAHYTALKESRWDIQMKKMAPVKSADLTYLDQGMAAWLSKEKEVQVRMQHYTDTKGKIGVALGHIHELEPYRNNGPAADAQYQEARQQYYHLNDIAGFLNTAVRDIGYKTRLFSAITATERITPPEPVNPISSPAQAASTPQQCSLQPVLNPNKPVLKPYYSFRDAHWQLDPEGD